MIRLILDLSREFHINPLILIGVLCAAYGLFGFHKINTQLHIKKDEEIERLKNKYDKVKDELFELQFKNSVARQSSMLYINEEDKKNDE